MCANLEAIGSFKNQQGGAQGSEQIGYAKVEDDLDKGMNGVSCYIPIVPYYP